MVDLAKQLDNLVTVKQNFSDHDNDEVLDTVVDREKLRVWNKITRVREDGTEVAVIIPNGIFFEPFYSDDDIDTTVTNTGVFDSTNNYFRLYHDANGNYKVLQSKVICKENNRNFRSVIMNVNAEYTDGSDAIAGIYIEIWNGNEWIAINNNTKVPMSESSGADLDADLNANLYASLGNFVSSGTGFDYEFDVPLAGWLFQNELKYRITRVSDAEVRIKKIKIKVEWVSY